MKREMKNGKVSSQEDETHVDTYAKNEEITI